MEDATRAAAVAESPSGSVEASSFRSTRTRERNVCEKARRPHGVCCFLKARRLVCERSLCIPPFPSTQRPPLKGSVAQMVERSLRMRQVQGSMPCTSIRGAGPLRRREGERLTHKVTPQRHTPVGCPALSPRCFHSPRGKRRQGRLVLAAPPTGVNASSWFPPKFPPG